METTSTLTPPAVTDLGSGGPALLSAPGRCGDRSVLDQVLMAQKAYAATHPWFSVDRLEAGGHVPVLEVTDVMVTRIESFLGELS